MVGVIGVLVRRNIIIIFMSIELILNAVNINLVALANQFGNLSGQVFAVFIIAVAAAEAAVGLGILLAFYRNKETVNIDEMTIMRW
jgi:NADH-quinone oxidoreductase subunit K